LPPQETETPSLISSTPEAENKPAESEAPPPEPVEPLTAEDITIPEGLIVSDELRDDFLSVLNAEMTPKERAQALIDLQAKVAEQASETASQQFADQQRQWQDEVKNDPELGGVKFTQTLSGIQRLVDQFGNEDFVNVMAMTGAGNNIHVVRFFHQIAQRMNEGGPISGSPSAQAEDAASRMFPSMKG
jgi:hypothetical protein